MMLQVLLHCPLLESVPSWNISAVTTDTSVPAVWFFMEVAWYILLWRSALFLWCGGYKLTPEHPLPWDDFYHVALICQSNQSHTVIVKLNMWLSKWRYEVILEAHCWNIHIVAVRVWCERVEVDHSTISIRFFGDLITQYSPFQICCNLGGTLTSSGEYTVLLAPQMTLNCFIMSLAIELWPRTYSWMSHIRCQRLE